MTGGHTPGPHPTPLCHGCQQPMTAVGEALYQCHCDGTDRPNERLGLPTGDQRAPRVETVTLPPVQPFNHSLGRKQVTYGRWSG